MTASLGHRKRRRTRNTSANPHPPALSFEQPANVMLRLGRGLSVITVTQMIGNWRGKVFLTLVSLTVLNLRIAIFLHKLSSPFWLKMLLGVPVPFPLFIPIIWLETKYLVRVIGYIIVAYQINPSFKRWFDYRTFLLANGIGWTYVFWGSIQSSNGENTNHSLSLHFPGFVWVIVLGAGSLLYGADIIGKRRLKQLDEKIRLNFSWSKIKTHLKKLILMDAIVGGLFMWYGILILALLYWLSEAVRTTIRHKVGIMPAKILWYWFLVRTGVSILSTMAGLGSGGRGDRNLMLDHEVMSGEGTTWPKYKNWFKDGRSAILNSAGGSRILYFLQFSMMLLRDFLDTIGLLPFFILSALLGIPIYLLAISCAGLLSGSLWLGNTLGLKSPLRTIGGIFILIGTVGAVLQELVK
jgi:hypothetical protein